MKTALITGATSGIGLAYAKTFAEKGYNLILTGRRRGQLEEIAHNLSHAYHIKVTICVVDFKNTIAFKRFVDFIKTQKDIEVLINNAGYGLKKSFLEDELEIQLEMLQVHVTASVTLAHLIANQLKATHKGGTVINVCSLAAFTPLPSSAMYCSTKHFLINFSESLAMELKPYNIQVQALCPGFVHTDFHSRLEIPREACKNYGIITWGTPEEVVRASLQGLLHHQVFVIPGVFNKLCYSLQRCIPRSIYLELIGRYSRHFSIKKQD